MEESGNLQIQALTIALQQALTEGTWIKAPCPSYLPGKQSSEMFIGN